MGGPGFWPGCGATTARPARGEAHAPQQGRAHVGEAWNMVTGKVPTTRDGVPLSTMQQRSISDRARAKSRRNRERGKNRSERAKQITAVATPDDTWRPSDKPQATTTASRAGPAVRHSHRNRRARACWCRSRVRPGWRATRSTRWKKLSMDPWFGRCERESNALESPA